MLGRGGHLWVKLTMARLTNDQIQFAKSMTIKQRRVLQALAMFPSGWYMSASERSDPELYELIRPNRLVQCCSAGLDGGLPSWGVTEQGRTVAKKLAQGTV